MILMIFQHLKYFSHEVTSLVLQRLLFLTLLIQSEIEQCLSVQLLSMVVLMTFQ